MQARGKDSWEVLLAEMELILPQKAMLRVVDPHYPGGRARTAAVSIRGDASRALVAEPVRVEQRGDRGSPVRDHLAAPSSTKKESGERDPEMHQTKKGNQRHSKMKALKGARPARR